MDETTTNTKQIAKNTLMLYFRQILIMLVSLYTVRVLLNVLGAEDYGIYNVVAGVVVLFSFINSAMATGTQRFLSYEIGKGDNKKINETYSASILIHVGISLFFVFIAETIGLWFVYYKLNLPETRRFAAIIVYQFTILTTIFNILRVPYNAVIISYEKMSFFAWISIIEALLKLTIVFLLSKAIVDKLIFYSFLLSAVSFIILLIFKFWCNKKFKIAHFSKLSDKFHIKEMISFSGWSLLGALANVSTQQGTNIVLNIFTNVTVNAAMGIANQVNSAVYSFVSNFQTAFNPQLIKTYASEEKKQFISLITLTSKASFFLLHIIALPLLLNVNFVLTLWLKAVPDYTIDFVKLILIWSLIDAVNAPLWMAVQATGNIKKYQIIISILIFLNLPCTIVAFFIGVSPIWVLIIRIIIALIITVWRIIYLCKQINFPGIYYFFNVILRSFVIFVLSYIICNFLRNMFSDGTWLQFLLSCSFTVIINIFLILIFGLNNEERKKSIQILRNRIRNK